MKQMYTHVTLALSPRAFAEIKDGLEKAGYGPVLGYGDESKPVKVHMSRLSFDVETVETASMVAAKEEKDRCTTT